MVQQRNEQGDRGKAGRSASARALYDFGVSLGYAALVIIFAVVAGLPSAFGQVFVRLGINNLVSLLSAGNPAIEPVAANLSRSLFAATVGFVTIILLPFAWRAVSRPAWLRGLAYAVIQILAICIALLIPDAGIGWNVALTLGGPASYAWWKWQKRWRGSGVAPSPISGYLRPEIHTGQIWYAVVTGSHETKVRPVMVLKPAPEGRWLVAYFTTQRPKPHLEAFYTDVPEGGLRGLPKENWVSLRDPRELSRHQFKTYTGMAPTWLYEGICSTLGLEADPHALTVNEIKAGEHSGPFESVLRRILWLRDDTLDVRVAASSNIKAMFTMNLTQRQPRPRKKK
jgi:hypothetical protein